MSPQGVDDVDLVSEAVPAAEALPVTEGTGDAWLQRYTGSVMQTFGTPQHRWLQANAVAFGWFHPSWAQTGGSKPEAWHWEFAG